jgi:hypothetical protein
MKITNISGSYKYFGYGDPSFGLANGAESEELPESLAQSPLFQADLALGTVFTVSSGSPGIRVRNLTAGPRYFGYGDPALTLAAFGDGGGADISGWVPEALAKNCLFQADVAAGVIGVYAGTPAACIRNTSGAAGRFVESSLGVESSVMEEQLASGAKSAPFPNEITRNPATAADDDAGRIEIERTVTLTYTAGAHGSIVGTAVQNVLYGASGTLVTATPAPGYHFVSWSDGVLTAARTDLCNVANLSAAAAFEVDP